MFEQIKQTNKHPMHIINIGYSFIQKNPQNRQESCFTLTFHKKLKSEQHFENIKEKEACFRSLFSTYIIYYLWRGFIHSVISSPFFWRLFF